MTLQMHPSFPLLIIVVLSSSSSSCYGRYIQMMNTNGETHRSYFPGYIGIRKYGEDDVQRVRKDRLEAKTIFNVDNYGAIGDGSTDDTKAFQETWENACSSSNTIFKVPRHKKYLLKPITFSGPCKSPISVQISGTILASDDRSDYENNARNWIIYKNINNLTIKGDGIIDGNGKVWWENSCKRNKKLPCKHAPTALTFEECEYLAIKNMTIQNAQQMHVTFQTCNNVKASGLMVSSPGNSPNTDGIHITNTKNIYVTNSVIGTGDDCISIVSGSQKVRAMDITCGPGHGVSIGSLGEGNSKAYVSDVIVNRATLSGTTNGLRIKTWQGGSGVASNIIFQNIILYNVDNPIIIDQEYCDQDKPCKQQASAVQVKEIVYRNITGTSASKKAVIFDCSATFPCKGITMENVDIEYIESGKTTKATCKNVQISKVKDVFPRC